MRHQIGVATLLACAVFTLLVGAAGGQDQHGARSGDAIDTMRDRDLQPERIMDVIGLRPGMAVGEAGASYGYFTFKMSRRVGPTGVVYANDIAPGALKSIDTRAASAKIGNIKTVLGEETDPRFPRNDLDMIVVFDCLFEFSQPGVWMKNAREYLKPGGRLVVVDPDGSKMASEHFLSRQQMHDFARKSGYTVLGVDDAFLKTHMIVVLRPLPREEGRESSEQTGPERTGGRGREFRRASAVGQVGSAVLPGPESPTGVGRFHFHAQTVRSCAVRNRPAIRIIVYC